MEGKKEHTFFQDVDINIMRGSSKLGISSLTMPIFSLSPAQDHRRPFIDRGWRVRTLGGHQLVALHFW